MYSESGEDLVRSQSVQALSAAGEWFLLRFGRGHGNWNTHVAIHHAASTFHQEIESPERLRLLENRAEIGYNVHGRFDDQSIAEDVLSVELLITEVTSNGWF